MKEIIKKPEPKTERIYKTSCYRCGCEFTYTREDVDVWYTETSGLIKCPGCGQCYVEHTLGNTYVKEEETNENNN